jgi:MFS family permease
MLGGILADYISRKRIMLLAILVYSIMTGLSAVAWDWISFVVLRFLVGIAIGWEWATGTSMIAELWPDGARGKGAGLARLPRLCLLSTLLLLERFSSCRKPTASLCRSEILGARADKVIE